MIVPECLGVPMAIPREGQKSEAQHKPSHADRSPLYFEGTWAPSDLRRYAGVDHDGITQPFLSMECSAPLQ